MIVARDIHKRYGDHEVLRGVSLEIAKGRSSPSSARPVRAKHPCVRCLNHLETIDRGEIVIEGETLASTAADGYCRYVADKEARRICRKMGMVFQHFNLFPHLTVLQNLIEAPITVKGMARDAIVPVAEELLRKVGLFENATATPAASGGQKQQGVAIARAWRWPRTSCCSTSRPGTRPGTHRRSAAHHAPAGRRADDHAGGHA